MILTPVDPDHLSHMLAALSRGLNHRPDVRGALERIAATSAVCAWQNEDLYARLDPAIRLAKRLGMETLDEAPSRSFSWDGYAVRTRTETAVLLHEIAHWQIAPPDRRRLPDFGLGAGPETGRKAEADAARCVNGATQEREENMASLLGVLWEQHLGGPAILAFCEQNWLELYDRSATAEHLIRVYDALLEHGLIDGAGGPVCVADCSQAA